MNKISKIGILVFLLVSIIFTSIFIFANSAPNIHYAEPSTGNVWSNSKNLTDQTSYAQDIQIAIDSSGNVHAVWSDTELNSDTSNTDEVHYSMYNTTSKAWERDSWPSVDINSPSSNASIAVNSTDSPFVVWIDYRDSEAQGRVYYNIYDDAAQNWTNNSVLMDNTSARAYSVDVAIGFNDTILVVWDDDRDTDLSGNYFETYYRLFNNTMEWENETNLTVDDDLDTGIPKVVAGYDDMYYIVYNDFGDNTAYEVELRTINASNNSYSDIPPIITSPDTANSLRADLAVTVDNTVHVVWEDARAGAEGIYYRTYNLETDTLGTETFLSGGYGSSAVNPSISANGTDLFVVWRYTNVSTRMIALTEYKNSAWTIPQNISINSATNAAKPAVASDKNGNAYIFDYDDYPGISTDIPNIFFFTKTKSELVNISKRSTISFNITAIDTDSDAIDYLWYFDDYGNATTDNFTYISNGSDTGWHNITVYVNSSNQLATTDFWNLSIYNIIPTCAVIPTTSWVQDTSQTLNLSLYITDLDEDAINYTYTEVDNIAIATDNDTEIATLTPTAGWTGSVGIVFSGWDEENEGVDCSNATFTVTASTPTSTPGGGSSGGGGGGSSTILSCTKQWSCSQWSDCTEKGIQTRTCSCSCSDGKCLGDHSEFKFCSYSYEIPYELKSPLEEGIEKMLKQSGLDLSLYPGITDKLEKDLAELLKKYSYEDKPKIKYGDEGFSITADDVTIDVKLNKDNEGIFTKPSLDVNINTTKGTSHTEVPSKRYSIIKDSFWILIILVIILLLLLIYVLIKDKNERWHIYLWGRAPISKWKEECSKIKELVNKGNYFDSMKRYKQISTVYKKLPKYYKNFDSFGEIHNLLIDTYKTISLRFFKSEKMPESREGQWRLVFNEKIIKERLERLDSLLKQENLNQFVLEFASLLKQYKKYLDNSPKQGQFHSQMVKLGKVLDEKLLEEEKLRFNKINRLVDINRASEAHILLNKAPMGLFSILTIEDRKSIEEIIKESRKKLQNATLTKKHETK